MGMNRLISIAMRMLMRFGMRRMNTRKAPDPNSRRARQSLKTARRIGRM